MRIIAHILVQSTHMDRLFAVVMEKSLSADTVSGKRLAMSVYHKNMSQIYRETEEAFSKTRPTLI